MAISLLEKGSQNLQRVRPHQSSKNMTWKFERQQQVDFVIEVDLHCLVYIDMKLVEPR